MKAAARLLLALSSLLSGGCALSYYRGQDGARLLRLTLGTDQQVGPFELRPDGALSLGGATTKQGETTAAAVGAAAAALKPTLLP